MYAGKQKQQISTGDCLLLIQSQSCFRQKSSYSLKTMISLKCYSFFFAPESLRDITLSIDQLFEISWLFLLTVPILQIQFKFAILIHPNSLLTPVPNVCLSELTKHLGHPSIDHIMISWLFGLSRWYSGKEPACQFRRPKSQGFNAWVWKIPWSGAQQPAPVLPGESHGQRSLISYIQVIGLQGVQRA